MALQSSGQIEMSEIAAELGETLSDVSLGDMSDTAGLAAPDAMSDFYGYSHTVSYSFSCSFRQNTSTSACSQSTPLTYYHNNASGGASTYPDINDYVYIDSGLNTIATGGYYKVSHPSFDWIRLNGFGRIYQTGICI